MLYDVTSPIYSREDLPWSRTKSQLDFSENNDTPTPILPLRDVVVYPHMVIPLFVGPGKIDPCFGYRHEKWQKYPASSTKKC